ncbi:MAG: hypothetical protein ACE5E5_15085 [Phycisphaerae bacterium]
MSPKLAAVLALLLGSYSYSQVYVYECDVLPLEAGWTLTQTFCDPGEGIIDGGLVYTVDICPTQPPFGQQIDYRIHISEFIGVPEMFFEWRSESTGDRTELNFTAPSSFVMADGGGVKYHFTIASDQIRYIRDDNDPWVYIDITPNAPHTFRVELFDVDWFTVFIDGVVVDEGIPEGTLMQFDPRISFRAKAQFVASKTTWEYMRWGVIPADGSGDFDSSGAADAFDLFYFSECFDRNLAGEPADPSCQWADFNADNTVDCTDAAAFATVYTGDPADLNFTQCNPIPAVSEWGMAILTLLVASMGAIVFRGHCETRNATAS